MADDSEYMTVGEFAQLPADAHHAVWKAAHEGRLDWIPNDAPNGTRRYHREQVRALLGDLAATR